MSFDSNSIEVQNVLSMILRDPSSNINEIIKALFPLPDYETSSHIEIWSAVQKVFEKVLGIRMERGGPKLIHRLRFSWQLLRAADKMIGKRGKTLKSELVSFDDIKSIFDGILPAEKIHDSFLEELCSLLHLDSRGGFVKHYYTFYKATKPKKVLFRLVDSDSRVVTANLERITWWIIRKDRYKYVEPDPEPGSQGRQIHMVYLTDTIREELNKWCNPQQLESIKNLSEVVENKINYWLSYSCLDGDNLPDFHDEAYEIANAFIADNELRHKVKIIGVKKSSHPDIEKRITELNTENARYAEENRALENEINELKKENASLKSEMSVEQQKKKLIEEEVTDSKSDYSIREIQDFLKRVDSKYSLEILRSVQLGEDYSITIKNFVSHMFYCLRKKGLTNYPGKEKFELDYDESGLYDCIDFSIPPGGKVLVRVEKQGWAFSRENRIFPVRKAVLRLSL